MQSAELVKDILQKWELHTDAVKGLECGSTGYHPCLERDEMTAPATKPLNRKVETPHPGDESASLYQARVCVMKHFSTPD